MRVVMVHTKFSLFISRIFFAGLILLILTRITLYGQNKKYALVIGAKTYSSMPQLRNSINDATLMVEALERKNFKVDAVYDPKDKAILKAAITKYYEVMKNEVNAVGVIYYAGHGVQYDGMNYIIPTSANLNDPSDINEQCVNMNSVIEVIKSLKHCLNIFIIDACRSSLSFYRTGEEGLAKVQAPEGSLIVFAAQPGKKASDGEGSNGLFTSRLAYNIDNGNLSLPELLRQVRKEVYKESQQSQLPEVIDNTIGGDFYFNPVLKPIEKPKQVVVAQQSAINRPEPKPAASKTPSIKEKNKPVKLTSSQEAEKMVEAKNYYGAKRILEPLCQKGDAHAQAVMADIYFNGWGVERDLLQCYKLNESSALAGDNRGQFQLGLMYLNGIGVKKNDEEGLKWLTNSANNDYIKAIQVLGFYYLRDVKANAKIQPDELKKGFYWFLKGAELRDPKCATYLGLMYREGIYVAKDPAEAMKWYSIAAEQKYDQAIVEIGDMYENGVGVPEDKTEAVKWYHSAAVMGSPVGQLYLGKSYLKGVGVTKNIEDAISNFKKSAEQGEARAMRALGWIYYKGEDGIKPDFYQGISWFEKAANAKDIESSNILADIYGTITPKNLELKEKWLRHSYNLGDTSFTAVYKLAMFLLTERSTEMNQYTGSFIMPEDRRLLLQSEGEKLLEKASAGGLAEATNQLGMRYVRSWQPNYLKGMEYFKKAAGQGLPVAMFNVGYLYETTRDFGRNKVEAIKWYKMAIDKGYKDLDIVERLKKLERKVSR